MEINILIDRGEVTIEFQILSEISFSKVFYDYRRILYCTNCNKIRTFDMIYKFYLYSYASLCSVVINKKKMIKIKKC